MASSGTVKTYNPHKGWGFIDMNGIDIFLNKKDLKGIIVQQGTPVTFNVVQTPKGQQANDVTVIMNPEQAQYLGKIKSFNPSKGFGFITAEAFPGQDIFVLKTDLPNGMAPADAQVQFKMVMSEKGPQAKEVGLLGQADRSAHMMKQMGGGMGGMGDMESMMMAMMSSMMGGGGGGGMEVWKPMFQKMGKGKGKGKGGLSPEMAQLKSIDNSQKVWVGGLDRSVNQNMLQQHFRSAGNPTVAIVSPKGTGCVAFASSYEAQRAIVSLNGTMIGSCCIQTDTYTGK